MRESDGDLRSWRPEVALRQPRRNGILCAAMNELRKLRRAIGLGQREFAALLSIPLETFRPWDSGRRVVSAAVRQRARQAVAQARPWVCQWESRKRTPSPVLWQRVAALSTGLERP